MESLLSAKSAGRGLGLAAVMGILRGYEAVVDVQSFHAALQAQESFALNLQNA